MTALQAAHGFAAEDVAAIHLGGYSATKDVCDRPVVETEQQARFSAQYCIGALLVLGGVRLAAFAPESLADPRIRAVMPKVTVSLDPALAQDYPARRAARLRVDLADGRVLHHHQPTRKGDPDAPLCPCSAPLKPARCWTCCAKVPACPAIRGRTFPAPEAAEKIQLNPVNCLSCTNTDRILALLPAPLAGARTR
jgi:hypothetical protein